MSANGSILVPRPAATAMVVRDGDRGLEVLLLHRNLDSGFVPGAHLFPGGAVETADHAPHPLAPGAPSDAEASARLELDGGGLAYWIAAVRETYEEAGILFADGPADEALPFRNAVDHGTRSFAEVCESAGLRLRLGDLRYFGHWTTPVGAPRRYSTRFFVAPVPEGQEAAHDEREAIDSEWVRPAVALDRQRAGRWTLILPTERSLHALARFDSVADLLAHGDAGPDLLDDHGGRRLAHPDEVTSAAPCKEPLL